MNAAAAHAFTHVAAGGDAAQIERRLAVEMPIAVEFGGVGYAVLMASPCDLADLVTGFALSERLIDGVTDIVDIDEVAVDRGVVVRVTLAAHVIGRVADRVRHRVSESACGMCGIENLEQALRPLPAAARGWAGSPAAVFAALQALDTYQPLNRDTGAVHAAAACTPTGEPWLVREDVGRHNAFDKLIGALLRERRGWGGGFALLTSRCSYELVEKAVLSACPMLATISAPTSLAVERAAAAGLPLHVLARRDAVLVR